MHAELELLTELIAISDDIVQLLGIYLSHEVNSDDVLHLRPLLDQIVFYVNRYNSVKSTLRDDFGLFNVNLVDYLGESNEV